MEDGRWEMGEGDGRQTSDAPRSTLNTSIGEEGDEEEERGGDRGRAGWMWWVGE